MKISKATPNQSSIIASFIMEAMNHECCQNLAGPHHTLADFHHLLTQLIGMEQSQYSYLNTLTALNENGEVIGVCVSYDGAQLHTLRQAFVDGAKEYFNIDYSGIDDETQAGELYIDSLCVDHDYRGQGIASALLQATIDKAKQLHLPAVGLLVDHSNPKAEHLYHRLGFIYANDARWGGHDMKHLVHHLSPIEYPND